MKKRGMLLVALIAAMSMNAQVPSAFNFQAVLRNADGEVLKDAGVDLIISILEDNKTTIYCNSLSVKTDSMGMMNVFLPSREESIQDSLYEVINQATSTLWIEMTAYYSRYSDEDGDGENEVLEGKIAFPSQQLFSVPYSMIAGNVILQSPNGKKYHLSVNDDGVLSTTLIGGVDTVSNRIPARKYLSLDHFYSKEGEYVIRNQEDYARILECDPISKVDFDKYTLVLYVKNKSLKDYYLEKISDTVYKFRKTLYPPGDVTLPVIYYRGYGLLIPKIDESITVDFTADSAW